MKMENMYEGDFGVIKLTGNAPHRELFCQKHHRPGRLLKKPCEKCRLEKHLNLFSEKVWLAGKRVTEIRIED